MSSPNVVRRVVSCAGLLFFVVGLTAQAQIDPNAKSSPPPNLRIDGQPVPESVPGPSPTLGFGWMLDETKVGLAPLGLSCASLPAYSGANPIPRGSVISNVRFTEFVDLSQGNIVIEKSCFRPTRAGANAVATTTHFPSCGSSCPVLAPETVVIRDSEFDGSQLSQQAAAFAAAFWGVADMQRNYIHDLGSGIALYNTGRQLSSLIEHNYVTRMISYGNPATTGNHVDGFTIRDFNVSSNPNRQAIIRNNRINTSTANATGSFFIQDTWSAGIGNILVTGNLLEGGGYEMAGEKRNAPVTNIRVSNNRFRGTTDGGYGACYRDGGFTWTEWTNNYLYSPTNSNNAGSVVTC